MIYEVSLKNEDCCSKMQRLINGFRKINSFQINTGFVVSQFLSTFANQFI